MLYINSICNDNIHKQNNYILFVFSSVILFYYKQF